MTEAHTEYGRVFQRFENLDILTGSTMLSQLRPQYLGMGHPFAWPVAVGGVDILGHPRWRRSSWEDTEHVYTRPPVKPADQYWSGFDEEILVGGGFVRIFDVVRSMSQHVEGQYRRNWSFVPGLRDFISVLR